MSTLYLAKTKKQTKKTKPKVNKTRKKRAKIIVHLKNGTCRKLMPYHQDPHLFDGNHSTVKNIFTFFIKECFKNMKVHFPCLKIWILVSFEKVFEIFFSSLLRNSIHNFSPR